MTGGPVDRITVGQISFAHYTTDKAGHAQNMREAVAAIERVDAFLSGVLAGLADDVLLVLTSDHGNIEDTSTGHTRNPALGVAVGERAEDVAGLRDLRGVTPCLLGVLGVEYAKAELEGI